MSSYAGTCAYCGKHVMHKTLFGTLHICLAPEQRQAIDAQRRLQTNQRSKAVERLLSKASMANKPIGGE
jgi:hypothetical protein